MCASAVFRLYDAGISVNIDEKNLTCSLWWSVNNKEERTNRDERERERARANMAEIM